MGGSSSSSGSGSSYTGPTTAPGGA
jgi:hypothetical protein